LSQSANRWTEIQTTEHPPDHPATFPEGKYLKAIYLRTEPARSSQFAGNR
jgi:23S rRNA (cytosine1962-C5)-methyltransferase